MIFFNQTEEQIQNQQLLHVLWGLRRLDEIAQRFASTLYSLGNRLSLTLLRLLDLLSFGHLNLPYYFRINQLKRDVKLLREMEQETAKILSPLFSDTVWLNRAYLMLKGQNLPESESRFKTLVLVLNGRIRHSLKLSLDVGTLHTAKVFSHILELDSLINEVMKLPRTPSLDHFQAYAKGILFRCIGDTFLLLYNSDKESKVYEELAFVSYSIAFDFFYKASPISPLLAAVFVLETLILRTLLHHMSRVKLSNSTTQLIGERLYNACNGVSTLRSKSFMISVNTVPRSHETHVMEQNEISRMIILADKNDFLINLLWLLACSKDLRNSAAFLDLFLRSLPIQTSDDDLQSFTLSSLTRTDAKILLLGAAKWSELCTFHGQKYGATMRILPPLAFTQPGHVVLSFWDLLVSFNKEMRINRSSNLCSENGLIITALEASRLRGEIPDVRIVDYIRKWLIANGDTLGGTKDRWIKLYSRVFMNLINGAHYENQSVATEDSFFPPLNGSGYDILDDAEKWFCPQDSSLPNNRFKADIDVLSTSEAESTSSTFVKPKSFLRRICTSKKSVLHSENPNSIPSPICASKMDNIRALELLSKDYEERYKNNVSSSLELNDFLTTTKENKTEDNLRAQIIKLQNDHAWDIWRLVQTINSLEEAIKRYATQYTTDLAIYTSKAYRQGYSDGYCSALQTTSNSLTNLVESIGSCAVCPVVPRTDLEMNIQSQAEKSVDVDYPHDPKECIGCAPEEG
uniref:Uncharacterized protein n=1 Tax=Setaria digitata TaxID=48799 RepID=A0A915Q295_9BILA